MPVALHIPLHPPPQCQDNTTSQTKSPDKPRTQREGVRGWVRRNANTPGPTMTESAEYSKYSEYSAE